jgi:hypothetical protein
MNLRRDLHAELMKELELVKDCSPIRHCWPMLPCYRECDPQRKDCDSDSSEDESEEKIDLRDRQILKHGLKRVEAGAECMFMEPSEYLRVHHDNRMCVVIKYYTVSVVQRKRIKKLVILTTFSHDIYICLPLCPVSMHLCLSISIPVCAIYFTSFFS